jgi:hypothetical protein
MNCATCSAGATPHAVKTRKFDRTPPLWPQLETILRPYVFGGDAPPARLLNPSFRTGDESMLTDCRKLLERVTERAGTLYIGHALHNG